MNKPEPSHLESDYWIFAIVLFMLAVVAMSKIFYGHFIADRMNSYLATRYLKQLIRKELALYHPYSLITLVLFAMAVSLVIIKAAYLFGPQEMNLQTKSVVYQFSELTWFFIGTGVVLLWILLRAFLLKIVQYMIGSDFGQTENRYRMIVFNQVCAYLIIPLVSMAWFIRAPADKWLILACLIVLGLNYLYRISQSLITAFGYSANVLYLFLYLCTLEIVPLMVLITLVLPAKGT